MRYRLRIFEIGDANKPNDPEWWGAWLINDVNGEEMKIGEIQVPGSWGWMNAGTGGFIEQFGPMPNECNFIPGMTATLLPATADGKHATASVSTHLYGPCEGRLKTRITMTPSADGSMKVGILDVGAAPPAPSDQGRGEPAGAGGEPEAAPEPGAPPPAACDDALENECKALLQDQVPWTMTNTQDPGTGRWEESNLDALCRCTPDPAATVQCFQDALNNGGHPKA